MCDVVTYLDAQVRALRLTGARLGTGEDRSVHQHRVAVRRIRSTLRTFAAALPEVGDLDERLREHGARLGEVRDLEVLRETLGGTLDGPTRDRLREAVADDLEARRTAFLAWLRSPEVAALVEDVAAYVAALPEDGPDLTPYVRAARRQARTRLRRAGSDAGRLHRARKAAKRARYAAEVVGDDEAAGRHELVQRHLGTHHDCAVAIEHLRDATPVPDAETAAMIADLEQSAEEARLLAVAKP
jgi:CHAD domain-containing protein